MLEDREGLVRPTYMYCKYVSEARSLSRDGEICTQELVSKGKRKPIVRLIYSTAKLFIEILLTSILLLIFWTMYLFKAFNILFI